MIDIDKEIKLKKSINRLEKREVKEIDTSLLNKNYKIDYKNSLNEEQLKALTSVNGQYLVIAGAGSGKTRTIIYRTAFLLEIGVKEENILMLTFTRKAGNEMKTRLETLLEKNVKIEIGTFHSFCLKLILKHKNLFNLENITIIDNKEKIIEKIIKKNNINLTLLEDKILNIIEALERGKNLNEISFLDDKEKSENIDKINFLLKKYIDYKKENNLVDFNDLIDMVLLKLKTNYNFKIYLQEKYKYIVIDEYQDTDSKQRDILKMLCGENGNLMVVGDDYQSIYGFRGAEFENILRFNDDFPNSFLIKLEKNYRSSKEIVNYCNRIASKFYLKYNKISKATEKSGNKPEILKFKNEDIQNRFIVDKIKKFYQERISYDEIAVIYRDRYSIKKLETVLYENNIPYRKNTENKLDKDEKISLISVHSSKGLEWKIVFIPNLLEGIFPSNLSEQNLEEEKRLYYVACSRSKEFLYLLYPEHFYEKLGYFDKKSSFLKM